MTEKKTEWINFEIKETSKRHEIKEIDGELVGVYDFCPPHYKWLGETDYYIGVCYEEDLRKELTPDEAYKYAKNARYYIRKNGDWETIGENGTAHDFLLFLSSLREGKRWDVAWPHVYENHYPFYRPDIYQVFPWRELIRRHFDQRAIVADRDLIIHRRKG